MKEFATLFNIPVVKAHNGSLNPSLIDKIRASEGIEGVVVCFEDGHMIKIKADAYVALHKVKSDINNERNVVSLLIEGKMDDLLPLLPQDDKNKVLAFQKDLKVELDSISEQFSNAISIALEGSRKDFALNNTIPSFIKHMVFSCWENLNSLSIRSDYQISSIINTFILKNCINNRNYFEMKKKDCILQNLPTWRPVMFFEESA